MSGMANTEARIRRLENIVKDDTGASAGQGVIRYPVRQLTMTEEAGYDDAGIPVSTALVSWKSPAGSVVPDKIKLTVGAEAVELNGQETSYRKGGYRAGDVVKVTAVAVYSYGNSSASAAQITMTGKGSAPETPLDFTVTGGFRAITIQWKIPSDANFSHIEIWESLLYDNLETAERVAQAYGSEFVRSNCGVLETRWYWLRAVDTGGNKGEFAGPKVATTKALEMEDIPDGTIEGSHLAPELSAEIGKIPELDERIEEAQENIESAKETLSAGIKEAKDYAEDQLEYLAEAAINALDMVKEVGDRVSDAGVYIDPDSGEVKIYGLEILREETGARISNAEIRLDAQEAQINSKVTLAQVDERIAEATFGDVGELLLSGVNARIDEVEETLDAQAVAISEKASSTQVEDHELRLTSAESDILGLDAAIALKASQLEMDAISQRLNSAELRIDAQNGVISQYVGSLDEDIDALSEASVQNAINDYENQKRNKDTLAYAKQELSAGISEVDGKAEANAAAITSLGVQMGDVSSALEEERTVRASQDEAYGRISTSLITAADDASGEAAVENALQGYENSKRLTKQAAAYYRDVTSRVEAGQRATVELKESLEAQMGEAKAGIEQVSEVVAGKPDVYNQPSSPSSESLKRGDLWIDNNSLIHRWTGSEWEECRDKELVELMELASAQTWLKAQVSASGRKVIAGIGVLADTTAGSEITMLADRFFLVSSVNGALIQPFAVDSTGSSPKIVINGNLFVQALKDGGYTDATGWIVGDRIAVNSRIQLSDGGELVIGDGGIIQIGNDGKTILLDTSGGMPRIRCEGADEYVEMTSGQVRHYIKYGDSYVLQNTLTQIETGECKSGEWCTLKNYYQNAPQVFISPRQLMSYDADSLGSQVFNLYVPSSASLGGVQSTGVAGAWRFKPIAELQIGEGGYNAATLPESVIEGPTSSRDGLKLGPVFVVQNDIHSARRTETYAVTEAVSSGNIVTGISACVTSGFIAVYNDYDRDGGSVRYVSCRGYLSILYSTNGTTWVQSAETEVSVTALQSYTLVCSVSNLPAASYSVKIKLRIVYGGSSTLAYSTTPSSYYSGSNTDFTVDYIRFTTQAATKVIEGTVNYLAIGR